VRLAKDHRYYSLRPERFVNQDPIGIPNGLNPFTYAGDNPVNIGDWSSPGSVDGGRFGLQAAWVCSRSKVMGDRYPSVVGEVDRIPVGEAIEVEPAR
jgi:hypothetical protein